MGSFRKEYILQYFYSRGWKLDREGELFTYLKPQKLNKFPVGFALEIPNDDKQPGFDNYILRMLEEYQQIIFTHNNTDDLKAFFSNNSSIIRYRFFDHDNNEGTINFGKYIKSLEAFRKVLIQCVTFQATHKQIYANANFEVDAYLNRCKSLQTEKGSFVSKFEVPEEEIYSTIGTFNTADVNRKLFDVIDFVKREVISPKTNHVQKRVINETYVADNKMYINLELLQSIKEIYTKTDVNNVEYSLNSNVISRTIITEKVQQRIPYFNTYIRDIKNILVENVALEVEGKVKRLNSDSPLSSNSNEVMLSAQVANEPVSIKLILKRDQYQEAVEAHKNEKKIRIKGLVNTSKSIWYMKDLLEFQILP